MTRGETVCISSEDNNDLVEIKHRLSEKYEMKDMRIARKFLGIQIEYGEDGSIKIYQKIYICDILARHGMSKYNPVSMPLDTSVKLLLRRNLNYSAIRRNTRRSLAITAIATRPDIMCAVDQLSQFNSKPAIFKEPH